jgi:hypothetical protein
MWTKFKEMVLETSVWEVQSLRVQRPHCARYAFSTNALRCEQWLPLPQLHGEWIASLVAGLFARLLVIANYHRLILL